MKYHILLLIFMSTGLSAQIRFNKVYDFGFSEWSYNVIINQVGDYVCIGGSKNFSDNANGLLVKYDTLGNITDSHRVIKPDLNLVPGWKGSIIQHPLNKNYYTVGYAQWLDSTAVGGVRSQVLTMRFLPSGDTVYCKTWGDTSEYFWINTLHFINNEHILIGGEVRHDIGVLTPGDFYFAKIDTLGQLLWQRRIVKPADEFMLNFFYVVKSKKIYAAGGRYVNPVDNFSKPHFKVLDDSANVLFTKEWTDSVYSDGAIVFDRKLSDSLRADQLLVVCGIDTTVKIDSFTNAYFYNSARITGVDTNFNIVWQKNLCDRLEIAEWYNARALQNGRVIVVGSKLDTTTLNWAGWATLLDDYGHEIWDRTYDKRSNALQEFYDVQECPDGGFIFTGRVGSAPPLFPNSDAWLVKVDSMGCEVPNCTPMIVEEPVGVKKGYVIYPNPNEGKFTLLSEGDAFGQGWSLELYDILGRLSFRQTLPFGKLSVELNARHLQSGNYLLRVKSQDSEIFKTKINIYP